MRYHVHFRFQGRQFNRSTGEIDKVAATKKAADIFAEVVRGPQEQTSLASLQAELSELKQMLRAVVSGRDVQSVKTADVEVKTLESAMLEFCDARNGRDLSLEYERRLRRRIRAFIKYTGKTVVLGELTIDQIYAWRDAKKSNSVRTKNKMLKELSLFLRWCAKAPRRWCSLELVENIEFERVPKRVTLPEVISPQVAENILRRVEGKHRKYICFYAIALLAGARANKKSKSSDLDGGEIIRLLEAVKRDGWERYFHNGLVLRVPTGKVLGEPRQIYTPENLKAWIRAYPHCLEVPNKSWHTRNISKPLELPRNGLRHTAASAFISSGGEFGRASVLFQSSEATLKAHYVNLMTTEQADGFWQIMPSCHVSKTEAVG